MDEEYPRHNNNLEFIDDLINNPWAFSEYLNKHRFQVECEDVIECRRMRMAYYDQLLTKMVQEIKKNILNEAKLSNLNDLTVYSNQTLTHILGLEKNSLILNPPDRLRNLDENEDCLRIHLSVALSKLMDMVRVVFKRELYPENKLDFEQFVKKFLIAAQAGVNVHSIPVVPDGIPHFKEHLRFAMLNIESNYDDFFLIWASNESKKSRSVTEADFISYCRKLLHYSIQGDEIVFENKNYRRIDIGFSFKKEFFENYLKPAIERLKQFLDQKERFIPGVKSKIVPDNQIKTTLSSRQLVYFFDLLKKFDVLRFPTKAELSRFAKRHFESERSGNFSERQAYKKSYELSESEYIELNELLNNMRNDINKHIPNSAHSHRK